YSITRLSPSTQPCPCSAFLTASTAHARVLGSPGDSNPSSSIALTSPSARAGPQCRGGNCACWSSSVEPPRATDLTPERERLLELEADLSPRLGAPPRVQHHAQDAIDLEPGVPLAGAHSTTKRLSA